MKKSNKIFVLTLAFLLTATLAVIPANAAVGVDDAMYVGIGAALGLNGIGVFGESDAFNMDDVTRNLRDTISGMPSADQIDLSEYSAPEMYSKSIMSMPAPIFNWVQSKLAPYIRNLFNSDGKYTVSGSTSPDLLDIDIGVPYGTYNSTTLSFSGDPYEQQVRSGPFEFLNSSGTGWTLSDSGNLKSFINGELVSDGYLTSYYNIRLLYYPHSDSFGWQYYQSNGIVSSNRVREIPSEYFTVTPAVNTSSGFKSLGSIRVDEPVTDSADVFLRFPDGVDNLDLVGSDVLSGNVPLDYSGNLDAIANVGWLIKGDTKSIRDILTEIKEGILSAVGSIADVISGTVPIGGIINDILPNWSGIGAAFSGIWHYVVSFVGSLASGISLFFGQIYSVIPYQLVLPVYASAVVVIVIAVFKRYIV